MSAAEASFERIVNEHGGTVLRITRSILQDDHLGADAAQETFLRLWVRLRKGRSPERFGAWLRRVAVTTALDAMRRSEAHRNAGGLRDLESPEDDPERRSAANELEQRFQQALHGLTPLQRTVFLLRHSGNLRLSEIAESLELSAPTTRTHFARACLKLQSSLRSYVESEPRGNAS